MMLIKSKLKPVPKTNPLRNDPGGGIQFVPSIESHFNIF